MMTHIFCQVFLCTNCVDKYDVSSQFTKRTNLPWLNVDNQLLSNMTIVEENTWTRRGVFSSRTDVDGEIDNSGKRDDLAEESSQQGFFGVSSPVSANGATQKCQRKRFSSATSLAVDLEGSDQLGSNVWRETSATNPELGTLELYQIGYLMISF